MNLLDRFIGMVSPQTAYQRALYRTALERLPSKSDRRYGGAARGRLHGDWQGAAGSGDARLSPDLAWLTKRSRQLETDNPYAKAATHNLTVGLTWVDARATHSSKVVARKAQASWDKFKRERKFFARQKVAVREMILGGTSLTVWRGKKGAPDATAEIVPSERLDINKTGTLSNGNLVRMGVETDSDGDVVAYWIFPEHPGDLVGNRTFVSERIEAQYVDHLFDELWAGQSRGVPWFYAALITLDDIATLEDALRIKKKVEACLTVVRKQTIPGTDAPKSLGATYKGDDGRLLESIAPGMVATLAPGEDLSVVNPSSDGDGNAFHKAEMMKASAGMGVPYHLVTGDVGDANYSALRADEVPFALRLDDWIHITVVPGFCEGWFMRCMRLEALKTGDKRYLDVVPEWSAPPRPWVDPLKDILALKQQLRLIPGSLPDAMARMGRSWREGIDLQSEVNAYAEAKGVILDSNPADTDLAGKARQAAADAALMTAAMADN